MNELTGLPGSDDRDALRTEAPGARWHARVLRDLDEPTSPDADSSDFTVSGAHAHAAAGDDDVGVAARGVEHRAQLGVVVVHPAVPSTRSPALRARAVSMTPFESAICPRTIGALAPTSSSPVLMTTTGTAYDGEPCSRPTLASTAIDRSLTTSPARPTTAPRRRRRRHGGRRRRRPRPGAIVTTSVPPSVRSTGTTRSRRCGIGAPVMAMRRRRRVRRRGRRGTRREVGDDGRRIGRVGRSSTRRPLRAHGVPVHRRVVERRQRPRRDDVDRRVARARRAARPPRARAGATPASTASRCSSTLLTPPTLGPTGHPSQRYPPHSAPAPEPRGTA